MKKPVEPDMRTGFIVYGLVDPRTDLVRYVGATTKGLARIDQHHATGNMVFPRAKAEWVAELRRLGLQFGVVVLQRAEGERDLFSAEQTWIAIGRGSGWPLTNVSRGGSNGAIARAANRARVDAERSR